MFSASVFPWFRVMYSTRGLMKRPFFLTVTLFTITLSLSAQAPNPLDGATIS